MDERTELSRIYKDFTKESFYGLYAHHSNLLIDTSPTPLPYLEHAYPFQWARLKRLSPAIEHVAGINPVYHGPTGFWEIAVRGRDKTTGLARIINWMLGWSLRELVILALAADSKQIGFLIEAMRRDAKINPWVGDRVKFVGLDERVRITGPGGKLTVQPANAKSAWGATVDILIVDELTWFDEQGKLVWDAIFSARNKRPNQVTFIISNAGILDSWQHKVYLEFKKLPYWDVYEYPVKTKTWMNDQQIADERKLITPGTAKRVFDNVWITASEDCGYIIQFEIDAGAELGKRMQLTKKLSGKGGIQYVIAIDYAARKDRTTMAICHLEQPRKNLPIIAIIDCLECWVGTPDDPVRISKLERWMEEMNISFGRPQFVLDEHQMESTIQTLGQKMRIERFKFRGGESNYAMAEMLKSVFADNRIAWYKDAGRIDDGEDFEKELGKLIIKRIGTSYRFDHTKNAHDDRTVAVGMALMQLFLMPFNGDWIAPPRVEAIKKPSYKNKKLGLERITSGRGASKFSIWGS